MTRARSETEKSLDVVFSIDENFLQHFTVACASLLENNSQITGRIFLLHNLNGIEKLNEVCDYFQKKYSKRIEAIRVPNELFNEYYVSNHISNSTYFRYLIPDLLPVDIERVLFLDSDIIVQGDLMELIYLEFTHNSEEYDLFAADHYSDYESLKDMEERFGTRIDRYFNAGVLLINLKAWRDKNMSAVLCQNTEAFMDRLKLHDQDVLNYTFNGKWGVLDDTYNHWQIPVNREMLKPIKIIHFIGDTKPWHYLNNHPGKYLYYHYLNKTPFKGYVPPDKTLINIIKRSFPKPMKNFLKKLVAKPNLSEETHHYAS